ncbi:MAG: DNA polymerase IV [Anaerolineales bacterium]|nr:DNA polymerase IV [Anaerolineales bacterium]
MTRKILHMDLDAFFCSVEMLLDPSLFGKPFVVGGSPDGRGVVASASYEAREYGIHSAMPTAQALRLCPDLIVVRHRRGDYRSYSKQVMERLRREAVLLEQLSIDEAFLDLEGDPRPGRRVARELQREIERDIGLPSSWGVATNKLVAKIASDVGKPRGLIVVPPGEERDFLAPLPVEMLWGVGPKTQQGLEALGVSTIGDLAGMSEPRLRAAMGDRGVDLRLRAHGIDERPVVEEHEPKSMSSETTFPEDRADQDELEATLLKLSERVGGRLRREGYAGSTVKIKVRWPDFTTLTRQKQLAHPTDQDDEIYRAALSLFHGVWRRGRRVRLLGVGVADLGPPVRQLELFDRSWQQDERLLEAVDAIREKYGPDSLRRAARLRSDED